MVAKNETALAVVPEGAFAMLTYDPKAIMDILSDNVGPQGPSLSDLDRIKVPGGGSQTWTIPGPNGDEDSKVYEGVVLAWRTTKIYWSQPMGEGGGHTPPDCSSDDGVTGQGMYGVNSIENPTGACAACPMNEWDSDPKGGRACRDVRLLLFLRGDALLPELLVVPRTSIGPCKDYFIKRLAKFGKPFYGVVTRVTLEKDKSKGGIAYSKMAFERGPELSPEDTLRARAMAMSLKPLFERVSVETEDAYGDGRTAAGDDFNDEPA